jgi:hypothetical protein
MRISFPKTQYSIAKEASLDVNHVFTGIDVADYDSALAWYIRFFGRSQISPLCTFKFLEKELPNKQLGKVGDETSIHAFC